MSFFFSRAEIFLLKGEGEWGKKVGWRMGTSRYAERHDDTRRISTLEDHARITKERMETKIATRRN